MGPSRTSITLDRVAGVLAVVVNDFGKTDARVRTDPTQHTREIDRDVPSY